MKRPRSDHVGAAAAALVGGREGGGHAGDVRAWDVGVAGRTPARDCAEPAVHMAPARLSPGARVDLATPPAARRVGGKRQTRLPDYEGARALAPVWCDVCPENSFQKPERRVGTAIE